MTEIEAAVASLQEALAYRFRDPDLLGLALGTLRPPLTPEAALARQRLEFLGDAAWNFAVAAAAFQAWPHATAGDLTRFRAAWSSTAGLARLAREIGLPLPIGPALAGEPEQPGTGEAGNRRQGDRSVTAGPSDRVLAEMLEAVLGAMVDDGGFEAIRALARHVIAQEGAAHLPPPVDPKSALQMRVQARFGRLPVYRLLERRGPPHHPTFRVVVSLDGAEVQVRAEAEGGSRQAAEQEAARLALEQLPGVSDS